MANTIKGIALIWGAPEVIRPIVNIPPDAIKVRLRFRNNACGSAFVKFADRIEHWILGPADGQKSTTCTEWKLAMFQGSNIHRAPKARWTAAGVVFETAHRKFKV